MASTGHLNVDRSQQNGPVYSEGHENYGYGSMFTNSGSGQALEQNWTLDPTAVNPSNLSAQSWNHSPAPQQDHPHRQQLNSGVPSYNSANEFYNGAYTSSAGPYQNSAFNNHPNFHQFSDAALDPSLVAPTTQQNGYRQGNQYFSPSVQSTIVPAALQHNTPPSKAATPVSAVRVKHLVLPYVSC